MENIRAILLLTFATACFAVQDMFIKFVVAEVSAGQAILMLGLTGSVFFAVMAKMQGASLMPRSREARPLYARTLLEGFASIFLVLGLALVPLAAFTSITQAMPLVMTLGAALFLGEKVGWRRWLAIALGFVGVLIIIRPGSAAFDPVMLLPLGVVIVMSARDLVSRRLPKTLTSAVVAFQGFGSLVFSGPILMLASGDQLLTLSRSGIWSAVAMIVLGIVGYYALILATRVGDVASVAPFRYSRLVFSLIIAVVVFDESPDMPTLLGAALIIGTGLYAYLRERRVLRQAAKARPT